MQSNNLPLQKFFFAALIYFLIAVILFHSLILNISNILFGGTGDCQGMIYELWARKQGFYSTAKNLMICAPFGVPNNTIEIQPLYIGVLILFSRIFGEIAGYNFLVFLSFPLTSMATYIFLNFVIDDFHAALIGGAVFGFCPAAILQAAAGHLSFAMNFTIPLFLLCFFRFHLQRTIVNSLLFGISFIVMFLLNTYWGFFGGFVGLYLIASDAQKKQWKKMFWGYLPAFLISSGFFLIYFFPLIRIHFSGGREEFLQAEMVRPIRELLVYSALPWDYFLPPINHPVLGKLISEITPYILHGSNAFEQTVYIGIIPFVIICLGLSQIRKKEFSYERKSLFLFFLGGAVWMFYISLPPYFPFKEFNLPLTPAYVSYFLLPMFRVLVRAGIFVIFFISCCISIVISEKIKSKNTYRKNLLTILLLSGVLFDFWTLNPHFFNEINTPQIYKWLSTQPGDFIVAEYPMMLPDEAPFSRYLFWQRIHKKRIINGASPKNKESWNLFNKVRDLSSPDVFSTLKANGVKYVLVHKDYYSEGRIPYPLKPYFPKKMALQQYSPWVLSNGFDIKPLITFGNDEVYEL